jgi:predicted TPR repeat methyltransferase
LLKDTLARISDNADRPLRFETVYDLGCGTGLMGEAIRSETGFLAGCDLSPRMIERARAKLRADGEPLYDKLAVAGLTSFLVSRPDHSADLVIAADVFVYLGELAPVFAQSARVLSPGGLLAFTVQSHPGDGVIVGPDRRFAHAEGWLRQRLEEARLHPVSIEAASTRQDRGIAVPGLIVVAQPR